MTDRLHVRVRGQVQGVGFRAFTAERAQALGLTGWVRNRHDGTVEVLAFGSAETLAQLRAALAQGPWGSLVTSMDDMGPSDETPPGNFAITGTL